jgi:GntP family gluconate:H+ symporter
MSVILIAALGVALVLVLILVVRLHPLLALLLGSLFLLLLTPRDLVLDSRLVDKQYVVAETGNEDLIGFAAWLPQGEYVLLGEQHKLAQPKSVELSFVPPGEVNGLTIAESVQEGIDAEVDSASRDKSMSRGGLVWYRAVGKATIDIGQKLVQRSDYDEAVASLGTGLGSRLTDGFAKTFRKLGIPVTMAAIVGVCLLQSGAATRLVQAIMHIFGPRGTAPALTASGFVLGIPVFFDNVFYLLLPLAKAVGRQRPEKFLTAVMAIIVGATMAHSLVPPTPGPLFVAEQMRVSVGLMMLGGLVVGSVAAACGFAYGQFCGRWLSLRPDEIREDEIQVAKTTESIPLWFAALPIGLPIALLGGSEVIEFIATSDNPSSSITTLYQWTAVLNDPSLIFIGAALTALLLLRCYGPSGSISRSVAKGLSDAGVIVLLTCAGGAFGAALQQLNLADAIGAQFAGMTQPWGLLFTGFFLTTIIRAAQGSATVAMLTSSAIIAPAIEATALPFHPLYMALAIGCGSKPLPWMNDSGFWQVTTMTGMTPKQTLKSFSVALTIMGVVGFSVTLLGAWLFPLV